MGNPRKKIMCWIHSGENIALRLDAQQSNSKQV